MSLRVPSRKASIRPTSAFNWAFQASSCFPDCSILSRIDFSQHELAAQIEQNRPMAPLERLERQLHDAVVKQDFERAAQLRDRLRELRGQRTEN
jgi:excinuclease UvrABC helicase subunit UvrB